MNRVQHRIFRQKRDEVRGGWRNVHNEELHNFYSLPNTGVDKSRRIRWVGYLAHMGAKKKEVYALFSMKTRRKQPLGRPRCKWENSIKMGHKEIDL
jgi:hypothetical protein